jgi:hypothetical protein
MSAIRCQAPVPLRSTTAPFRGDSFDRTIRLIAISMVSAVEVRLGGSTARRREKLLCPRGICRANRIAAVPLQRSGVRHGVVGTIAQHRSRCGDSTTVLTEDQFWK